MINYTERLTLLMQDIVQRVPALSFIDIADVLVFARPGRSSAEGAFATCHCLTLPPSEPGYYFWRDRESGHITRRSEWFVTRSPVVTIGPRQLKYLFSFSVPRFCDQTFDRSRKERFYAGQDEDWIARLDTVVHELYHIDPDFAGIRRIDRGDGTFSANCHGNKFFEEVAAMVKVYVDSRPDPAVWDFLQYDFAGLEKKYGGVVATSFRAFPSYPQRFIESLAIQPPCEPTLVGVELEKIRPNPHPTRYTQDDLHVRHFLRDSSRQLIRKGQFRAA